MKHLYTYTLTLPLTYFTYDLRSDDSEFILGLPGSIEWEESIHIEMPYPLDDSRVFVADDQMHFCLTCGETEHVSDDGKSSYWMPDKYFVCTVSGIVAASKTQARELVDASIRNACKSLSILMSCGNCNKQGYQPRVEPDYKQQSWQKEEYPPYAELVAQALEPVEYIDEQGNRVISVYVDSGSMIGAMEVSTTLFGKVDATRFFEFYHYQQSADLSFILDEYYTALGQETMTSKFFHLFSIIEYVEKNFVHLAEAKPVFEEADKLKVLKCLEQIKLTKDKKDRLRSMVSSSMSRATEIGREAKLVKILHAMGVKEFKKCGTQFAVDKDTMKELTTLRNSYYHGDGKKVDGTEKHISVELAVARLMYICEGIILYVMREGSDRREHGED